MKIDFTSRDIELMLMMLHEVLSDKIELNDPDVMSMEEFALLEKLENALRNSEASEQETFDAKTSNVYH